MSEQTMSEMEYFLETLDQNVPIELINALTNNIVVNLFQLACYVLGALALYTMAKRRGLRNAWLSWIPIGNLWILGSLADQYRYVARKENKKKRKTLMKLIVVSIILSILITGLIIGGIIYMVQADLSGAYMDDVMPTIMVIGVCLLVSILAAVGVGLAQTIIRFMALSDVYRSANPEHAVLFLVLSIFFRVTEPFFLFFNRNSDVGMSSQSSQAYQQPRNAQNYQTYQANRNTQTYQSYQAPQNGQTYQSYQAPQNGQPYPGYQAPQNGQTYQGYQAPQNGQTYQGYQAPQNGQSYQGYQAPQNSQPYPGYQAPQNGQSYPGYQNPNGQNPGSQSNLNPTGEDPWAQK